MRFHACDNKRSLLFYKTESSTFMTSPFFISKYLNFFARRKKRSETCKGFRWYNSNTSGISFNLRWLPKRLIVIKQLYY